DHSHRCPSADTAACLVGYERRGAMAVEELTDLSVRRLCVSFGSAPILRDVSFTVASGRAMALVGYHGAGKTTTLTALAGALDHTATISGEVSFGSYQRSVATLRPSEGLTSLVPERAKIFPTLTVDDNLSAVGTSGEARIR